VRTNQHSSLTWLKRLALTGTAVASMAGLAVVASPAANAEVFGSCTISGCADASSANSTWQSMGYPDSRGWYNWPDGECNYAGGTYYNDDGQLPSGDSFQEFDVNPRACGAHRDAARIVVDMNTGEVWYSPDHYSDFYQL
jgi:guanyl-specific ribonuclease Sa